MWREVFGAAADGTRLFADDRGPVTSLLTPVLCLPGLTRNSRDFEPVFDLLAGERRVIAMDLRGRGRSDRAEPSTYTIQVELQDTLALMNQLGIERFALLGTSRGGLIGILMAAIAKDRLAGLLLNDIGPELDRSGLLRIIDFVGTPVCYNNWDEAAKGFAAGSRGFHGMTHEQWLKVVQRIYIEADGFITHSHDLALAKAFPHPDALKDVALSDLWDVMPALSGIPVHVLRGENSDLLSAAVTERMATEVPLLEVTTIAGRGHVPILDEPESMDAIGRWLQCVDLNEKGR